MPDRTHTQFTFSIQLSETEYQEYYRGVARSIVVMTHQGVRIQFPASALRSYITRQGIHGDFVIIMDSRNKLVSIKRRTI